MLRILKGWLNLVPAPRFRQKAVIATALLVGTALVFLHAWWLVVPAPPIRSGAAVVEISPNHGVVAIAGDLAEAGVIRSRLGFLTLAALRGSVRALKAGEYEFPRGVNTLQILKFLEEGRVRQHLVRFPEGGTVRDLAEILEAEGLAQAADVLELSRDWYFLRALEIEAPSLEGYLFPDTYQFFKGQTVEQMLTQMVRRLREKLTDDILVHAESRGLTVHRLLTLASIIEREAVIDEDLRLISGVFWNRLKRGMPLQADPTVQYALGKERQALTRADLQVISPFNTYRAPGLPPGPIASPGRAAIRAALNPAKVKYLYFVSIDNRRHHFSVTLNEHNAAVARYRVARAK